MAKEEEIAKIIKSAMPSHNNGKADNLKNK
jgi:hypothetical protein